MVRITFLHPDLGIGGAERLVVDAAVALKKQGHEVNFITSFYDPERCFSEIKDETIPVHVVGDWIPRHILGRFFALCAYIRMIYAACWIYFMEHRPHVVFCDLVSVCIPFLRLSVPKVIYYCHHPDQVLTAPGGHLKSLYRTPLNYLEEITTGQADKIFVNSIYTSKVFKKTFTRLSITPEILYPSLHTHFFDSSYAAPLEKTLDMKLPDDSIILLSINRYERKKNLGLAIETLAELRHYMTEEQFNRTFLIMAGGYDKRVEENVEHHLELVGLASELGVTNKVIFLRSPSDSDKVSLLKHCHLLIYTPPNEHFGIVPLEAMYFEKPVVAHNSGGPMETVVNDVTGFLVNELSAEIFAQKIVVLIRDKEMRSILGRKGKARVIKTFSFDAFSDQLNKTIDSLLI